METKKMDGGDFSFGAIKRKFIGEKSLGDVIRNTKRSESALINSYEDYDDKTQKYNKAYNTHIQNLKELDDFINFKGMETLFKKIIMKDNFNTGHIDKSNPLLFRNYLIESDVPPSTFRKEHILQQVRYILNKYFPSREHMFIKYMDVDVGKTAYNLNIVTIDDVKKSRKINHEDYIISKSETKKALSDVLSTAKKNLKRNSKLIEYNISSKNSGVSSFKSKDKNNKKKISSNNDIAISKGTRKGTKKGTRKATKKATHKSHKTNLNNMLNLDLDSHKSEKNKNSSLPDIKSNDKPSKNEKLSMYWTKSERQAAKDAAKPKPLPTPVFAAEFNYQPTDLGLIQEQAQGVLAGNVPPITQPFTQPFAQPFAQPAVQEDPENTRCGTYSSDYNTCRAQNCLFSLGRCVKKEPRPQLFGALPPPQNPL